MYAVPKGADKPVDIAVVQPASEYSRRAVTVSLKVIPTTGFRLLLGDAGVMLAKTSTGELVSMTIAFCPLMLAAEPRGGNVNVAILPTPSLMVPLLR
jgi:hypothetical protein